MPDKINILVVDDLPDNLLVVKSVLEELDQNVITARSGSEVLRQVMDHDFSVILLDVNMPDIDGYETAALIRKRKKSAHTPIIFITAYADEMNTAHGYTLGAVDFILSPVVPDVLRTKVKVFVDLFRMTQQIKRQAQEQVTLAREQAARSAAEETVRRLNFLAEASKILASSLDLKATVHGLLELIVVRPGDLGAITLLNEQGQIRQTELGWTNSSSGLRTQSLLEPAGPHPAFAALIQRVIRQGKPEYLSAAAATSLQMLEGETFQNNRELPTGPYQAIAILPLLAGRRPLGALTLAMKQTTRWQSLADLALIEDLARRAAIAIDNAQLYRDIQEADRRKNNFLSMLAHELRNPLAPLLNGIQILARQQDRPPDVRQIQDMMNRQVHHLVRLVDDLLDISRISRDQIKLQREPIEVAVVVSRAVEVSRPLLDARLHELTVRLPEKAVWVYADPVRLAQVLSNLLNNAAKYTEKGGRVWLTVETDAGQAIFRVRDNGFGIPPEMLSSVFEMFTQVKRSSDLSQGGLGVGLSLVRRLVEMHAGSVEAYSAGSEQGSEFVVRIPMLAKPHQPPSAGSAPLAVSNGFHRILIVDDNPDVTETTAMLLSQIGAEVRLAHDGPAALTAASAFRPDVILLDIGLPSMDGYEVARRLRMQTGFDQVLLVALSGFGQDEDRQRSHEAGFDHHLVKPATLQELTAILANPRRRSKAADAAGR